MARDEGSAVFRLIPLLGALTLAARAVAGEPETIVIDVKDPLVRVRAELDLFINGAKGGPVFVVLQRGDCLLARGDLEQAGLAVPGGQQVLVDGTPLLSMKSLAPFITFTVDEAAVALRITAPASLLGRRRLDLRPRLRPEGLELRWDPSAFLDYAVDAESDGRVGFTFQAGGRLDRWLATSTLSGSRSGGWSRGLTSAVRDDVEELRRWTLGDAAAHTGPLGGAPLLGGGSVAREFSLDPYLVQGSFPSATVVVDAPATLEVYVNGSLVRREPVGPGYWDLSNIPATQGQTLVQTVLRDAFGRERTLDNRFYYSAGVLARGLSDYAVAAGFRRESFSTVIGDYGRPALLGRYRVGLSDAFTPGGRLEAAPDLLSGGASAAVSLPWGEVDGPPPPPVRGPAVAEGDVLAGAELARIRCLVVAPFENTSDLSKLGDVATSALLASIDPEQVKVFPIADLRELFRDSRLALPPEGVAPRLALSLAERVGADGVVYGLVEGRAQGSATDFMVTVRLQAAGGRELLFASASQVRQGPGESVEVALRRTLLVSTRPLLLRIGSLGPKKCFDPELVKRARDLRSAPTPQPAVPAPPPGATESAAAPPPAAPPPPPPPPSEPVVPAAPAVATASPPPEAVTEQPAGDARVTAAAPPVEPVPRAAEPPKRPKQVPRAPAVSPTLRVAKKAPARTARQAAWAQRLDDGRRFVLADVEFAGRTAALIDEKGLVDLAGAMAATPDVQIRLEVFVDATEDPSADAQVSMAQAMAVTRRLAALGVDRGRIAQEAKGGADPLVPNFTARGREKNRRVEIVPLARR